MICIGARIIEQSITVVTPDGSYLPAWCSTMCWMANTKLKARCLAPALIAYYPRSMRNLPPEVRLKAIEIPNALLEEGYDEGKAIRIAIAKAKEWAERSR
jgi:hypothetical protein